MFSVLYQSSELHRKNELKNLKKKTHLYTNDLLTVLFS